MRTFLKLLSLGAALAVALFVYAWQIEPKQLAIRYTEIGSGEQVIKIALVSDLHIGGVHVSPARVKHIVQRINQKSVDITLIPGDFVNGHESRSTLIPEQIREIDEGISHLQSLTSDAFASLGNHDNWHDPVSIRNSLEAAEVTVLDNEIAVWGGFCVVGLADSDTAFPNSEPFEQCSSDQSLVAMMHSPDARSFLPSHVLLAVSGHTHGGQVNLPFLGRAVTSTQCGKPCAYGLIQDVPPLFVTSGIGTSILPIRFRSKPEIVFIDLRY